MKKRKKQTENKVEYQTVSLPIPLINKIKEKIKGTGVPSVSSYVAFVLRQIMSLDSDKKVLSEKEEEELRRRLKNLGYI
jgi:hypothetical protein